MANPDNGIDLTLEMVIKALKGLKKQCKERGVKPTIEMEMRGDACAWFYDDKGYFQIHYDNGDRSIKIRIDVPPYITEFEARQNYYKRVESVPPPPMPPPDKISKF